MLLATMKKTVKINITKVLNDATFDAPILLIDAISKTFSGVTSKFESSLKEAINVDSNAFKSGVSVIPTNAHPSGRLIVSCAGNLSHDYDDARRLYEAAQDGVNRAVKMGLRKPMLILGSFDSIPHNTEWGQYPYIQQSCLLGALNALYMPLETQEYAQTSFGKQREMKMTKADFLGFYQEPECDKEMEKLVNQVWAIEEGKRVARDIGGSDPMRMTPKKIVEYLEQEFQGTEVQMESVSVSEDEYPLAAAVNRGSKVSETHDGRILKLQYFPKDKCFTRNIFLVGKGVTYDTGGHDLKTGGNMAFMHRDKCGAGVVAGIFKTISILNPIGTRFVGRLGCVRNAIGADAYVSDEIITARSGMRVRVNNTDAEGRMVMGDLLAEMTEEANHSINPHLFTIATLTGHALNTFGEGYGAIVTNRPGRKINLDQNLQKIGELVGDCFEISRIRREDWRAHVVSDEYADLTNSFAVRGKTQRGHQSPAVFLMQVAGMDKILDSGDDHLVYAHLDIAGPEVKSCPNPPTAAGLTMLVSKFVLDDSNLLKPQ